MSRVHPLPRPIKGPPFISRILLAIILGGLVVGSVTVFLQPKAEPTAKR